jgi:hypothetical protein
MQRIYSDAHTDGPLPLERIDDPKHCYSQFLHFVATETSQFVSPGK